MAGSLPMLQQETNTQPCKAISHQFKTNKTTTENKLPAFGAGQFPRPGIHLHRNVEQTLAGLELAFSEDLGSVITEFS